MNDYTRLRLQAETHKKQYPPGTRIYLERMNDPYAPVPSGTRGTVHHVDDMDSIHMRWDNHRTLPLSPDEDSFRALTAAELNEELRRDHEIVNLGDDCEIVLPEKPINCSELTYFDELEYECWHLMEKYCERMGIKILDYDDSEKPISFDIAKNIQEVISTLKSIMRDSENRHNRNLYRIALELSMLMNVMAATHHIPEESLQKLRGECEEEIRRINGSLSLDTAVKWQS